MLMKMAAVLPVALILLGCSCVSCADPSGTCESVEAGGTVVVPMTIAVDESYKLTWKHNDTPILRRRKGVFSLGSKDLVTANGSLQLTNVAQSNAGVYTAEVHDADGKIKGEFKPWSLCVLDPVSKPTVDPPECLLKDKPTKVKFTCKVPSQANVTWLQKDEVLDEKGPTLTREINQVKSDPIVCRVSNGISTEESEAVHHSCVEYDPVSKPTVDPPECLPKDKPTKVKFTCKVPSQAKVTWLQNGKVLDEKGPNLTREINQVKSDPISCKVSNGVSTKESEAVHHSCVDYASFWFKETLGISNWILVASGGGVVLLIIVVIVCCVCTKRRNRLQLEEGGELCMEQQHQLSQSFGGAMNSLRLPT